MIILNVEKQLDTNMLMDYAVDLLDTKYSTRFSITSLYKTIYLDDIMFLVHEPCVVNIVLIIWWYAVIIFLLFLL